MLYKHTLSSGYDNNTPHIFPLDMYDMPLLKASVEMHPDVLRYLQTVKPIPGKSIILVDALGAGEYWGSNVNGDYFPEDQLMHEGLDYGYKTFEHYAYPYIEHMNEARIKDPNRRVGEKVQLAVYFHPMHRVQLVIIINKVDPRTSRIVERIDSGEYPDVSMACSVKYDQCSVCGSKHRIRREYCEHARNMLNRIFDDGRKVYLYNYYPKFHDISLVFVGAEKNSKVLMKIASKQANIRKNIDLQVTDIQSVPEKFTKKDLKALSKYNIEDVMHAMREKGYSMSPEDFQYMVLNSLGQEKRASYFAEAGIVFDLSQYTSIKTPEGKKNEIIDYIIDNRKMYKNASQDEFIKKANNSIVAPVLAGLYHSLNVTVPKVINNVVNELKTTNQAGVALGYLFGRDIGENVQKQQYMGLNQYQSPIYIPDYTVPFPSEFIKFAGVRDALKKAKGWLFPKVEKPKGFFDTVYTVGKGIVGSAVEHPILVGGGIGLAGYAMKNKENKRLEGQVDEEGNPIKTTPAWQQGLKWGAYTGLPLLALNYFYKKGLRPPT